MKTIKVWSCCGAFGWFCPWGTWLAGSPQLTPAGDESESYVYLFSRAGQLGNTSRAEAIDPRRRRPALPKNCIGIVDLDDFIDAEGFRLDWDGVYREIVRVAEKAKEIVNG